MLSLLYLGWVAMIGARLPHIARTEALPALAVLTFILGYGAALSILEDQMAALFVALQPECYGSYGRGIRSQLERFVSWQLAAASAAIDGTGFRLADGADPAMTEADDNNFTVLRLVLALMVVLGHAKLLSGTAWPQFPFNLADAAVDAFFVVSGFLITGSYQRCHGLWSFYVRRIFRLYPMYLCIVLAQTVAMLLLLPGGPFSEAAATLRYVVANALLANFVQYDIGGVLDGLRNPGINPSLWTLKIEIGFYLIVPAICAATQRWGPRVLVAIFCGSVATARSCCGIAATFAWRNSFPASCSSSR